MKNLWNDEDAGKFGSDSLKLRVYSSRLLGQDTNLVLHGGGNTSVKGKASDLFGDKEDVLFVKGSGWDLETIDVAGFAAVKLSVLQKMATLDALTDKEMVKGQRAAMMDPSAPNPSVEAILHAIIPFKYVDHTHADAVVTLTNNPRCKEIINEVYGDRVFVIPYVMPGFVLSKKVHELCQGIDWSKLEGLVLLNHGLFTFDDQAKASYEKTIKLVSEAETYLEQFKSKNDFSKAKPKKIDLERLTQLRKSLSAQLGQPIIIKLDEDELSCGYASLHNIADIACRGPLTPDHVIRTKRIPLIIDENNIEGCVSQYAEDYAEYFTRNTEGNVSCLDPMPRFGIWPNQGILSFAKTVKDVCIIADINKHTCESIQYAEAIGGWQALPEKDIFEVEYWELEQAKLGKSTAGPLLQGKIALVTGAASGIGKACMQELMEQGACVIGLDINPQVEAMFSQINAKGICCDVTDTVALSSAVMSAVKMYGGLDILISNAGIFPQSMEIENMDVSLWNSSLDLNLSAQQRLLTLAIPYLKQGIDPVVIFVASKNVSAPGPGQAAYSIAKAGVTQLMRIAALELGRYGIRVHAVHPNAVFDTGVWSDEQLQARADHYGMSVEDYKSNNILKTEITSNDVARLISCMSGSVFSKSTGVQIPIDGGNDRVI
jgi:rhamnose utilization protein RhaD (predicted bifunctional aldolase and dehydrogenase)/NAD(P)-dependent dehydrogenase (short-subunit alcohol dehydrogenase family)